MDHAADRPQLTSQAAGTSVLIFKSNLGSKIVSYSHEGRVAVITGAASGLGPTYARRFAQDGADVVLVDLLSAQEVAAEVEALGRRALVRVCDVSDAEQVAELGAAVEDTFGRADILFNNVGISPFTAFEEMTHEQWRQVLTVNLDSLFLMTQTFLPMMKRDGYGRIINVSSGVGWTLALNLVHYTTSKMGVVGFTRALATELGPLGITVNAVSPGLVWTPALGERYSQESFDRSVELQAIKRSQTPEDLAGVVSFLASEDARFVTGQTISVDGGMVRL